MACFGPLPTRSPGSAFQKENWSGGTRQVRNKAKVYFLVSGASTVQSLKHASVSFLLAVNVPAFAGQVR